MRLEALRVHGDYFVAFEALWPWVRFYTLLVSSKVVGSSTPSNITFTYVITGSRQAVTDVSERAGVDALGAQEAEPAAWALREAARDLHQFFLGILLVRVLASLTHSAAAHGDLLARVRVSYLVREVRAAVTG